MIFDKKNIILLTFIIVILFVLYIFYYYKFDAKIIKLKTEENGKNLYINDFTLSLLNGSGINNIPNLNIITSNNQITEANNCNKNPLYIGNEGNEDDCIRICLNDSAKPIYVNENEDYFFNNSQLKTGVYCFIGSRPECNMKTTTAIMTINSVICRSKFPKLAGGKTGSKIIACNNSQIYNPLNVLWDNAKNERVNLLTTIINDENELMPDKTTFRFECRFKGLDEMNNNYIQHPHDRFHPIRNYCANNVYGASLNVKTIFSENKKNFKCDCGDYKETRVRNIIPNNPSSQCSNKIFEIKNLIGEEKKQITIPYKCFTVNSPITDVGKLPPCPEKEFLTPKIANIASFDLIFTENENAFIEHPEFENFEKPIQKIEVIDRKFIW